MSGRHLARLLVALLLPTSIAFGFGGAHADGLTWTSLVPKDDSRPDDMRHYDETGAKGMVAEMNETEKVFRHRLTWRREPISRLLDAQAPFCELDFDVLHPLVLTPNEKRIMREYLTRGGFIMLCQDAYPYSPDLYWQIKSYPAIDFVTRELPAADPGFTSERIDEHHPVFRQYHTTRICDPERNELRNNPNCPDFTLVSYRGQPCAFIYGNYYCDGEKWAALPRPFAENLPVIGEDYYLNVNMYIYVTMH